MGKKNNKHMLDQLFEATITILLQRIKDGVASPADISVARQFLKDNGITAGPTDRPQVHSLVESLPFEEELDP